MSADVVSLQVIQKKREQEKVKFKDVLVGGLFRFQWGLTLQMRLADTEGGQMRWVSFDGYGVGSGNSFKNTEVIPLSGALIVEEEK